MTDQAPPPLDPDDPAFPAPDFPRGAGQASVDAGDRAPRGLGAVRTRDRLYVRDDEAGAAWVCARPASSSSGHVVRPHRCADPAVLWNVLRELADLWTVPEDRLADVAAWMRENSPHHAFLDDPPPAAHRTAPWEQVRAAGRRTRGLPDDRAPRDLSLWIDAGHWPVVAAVLDGIGFGDGRLVAAEVREESAASSPQRVPAPGVELRLTGAEEPLRAALSELDRRAVPYVLRGTTLQPPEPEGGPEPELGPEHGPRGRVRGHEVVLGGHLVDLDDVRRVVERHGRGLVEMTSSYEPSGDGPARVEVRLTGPALALREVLVVLRATQVPHAVRDSTLELRDPGESPAGPPAAPARGAPDPALAARVDAVEEDLRRLGSRCDDADYRLSGLRARSAGTAHNLASHERRLAALEDRVADFRSAEEVLACLREDLDRLERDGLEQTGLVTEVRLAHEDFARRVVDALHLHRAPEPRAGATEGLSDAQRLALDVRTGRFEVPDDPASALASDPDLDPGPDDPAPRSRLYVVGATLEEHFRAVLEARLGDAGTGCGPAREALAALRTLLDLESLDRATADDDYEVGLRLAGFLDCRRDAMLAALAELGDARVWRAEDPELEPEPEDDPVLVDRDGDVFERRGERRRWYCVVHRGKPTDLCNVDHDGAGWTWEEMLRWAPLTERAPR